MNIFVVGITSNLFVSLLPNIVTTTTSKIFGLVRDSTQETRMERLRKFEIDFCKSAEECLEKLTKDTRVLWLSTHDDPIFLEKILEKTSYVLVISSGALFDFIRGKQNEDSLNAYQKSKLNMFKVLGVSSIIPGFYLEDTTIPDWASKGLHGETTDILFKGKEAPPGFNWDKLYSVTPKSSIVEAIVKWLHDPKSIVPNEVVIVCSEQEYTRRELNTLEFVKREPIYAPYKHIVDIIDDKKVIKTIKKI